MQLNLYRECRAGAQIIFPESGRGLGHVIPYNLWHTIAHISKTSMTITKKTSRPIDQRFLADRLAYATVLRLSVVSRLSSVCDVMYCG